MQKLSKPRTSASKLDQKDGPDTLSALCQEYFQVGMNTASTDTQLPSQESTSVPTETINLKEFITIEKGTPDMLLYDMDLLEYQDETLICTIHNNRILLYMLDPNEIPMKIGDYSLKVINTKEPTLPRQTDVLYVCRFGFLFKNENSSECEIVIITAGRDGFAYIYNLETEDMTYLAGHVHEIYDICLSPWRYDSTLKNLMLSCSRDGSVSLWNYKTRVQIASYKPGKTPILDSICVDWHTSGREFLQSCIDGSVSVWELGDVDNLIKLSQSWTKDTNEFPRKDFLKYKYRTYDMHENYVDCVAYLGDMIVSKDVDGKLAIWINSGIENEIICFSRIRNKTYECVWSLRMQVSMELGTIVYGNDMGTIFLLKMENDKAPKTARYKFETGMQKVIRKVMLTKNGTMLFALADGGRLWYYKLDEKTQSAIKTEKWDLKS